jgi:hypothetical protein
VTREELTMATHDGALALAAQAQVCVSSVPRSLDDTGPFMTHGRFIRRYEHNRDRPNIHDANEHGIFSRPAQRPSVEAARSN